VNRVLGSVSAEARLAGGGVLLGVAAADGVVDDDELMPILDELDLGTLGPDEVDRFARWLIHPPPVEEVAGALLPEPIAVRCGLVVRMLEIAGADAFLAHGELDRLQGAAHAIGVDDDQVGAIRVFLDEMGRVAVREPGDTARERRLEGAGQGLVLAGVPWGALTYSAAVAALGVDADRLGPALGFPPGVSLAALVGAPEDRAGADDRIRVGLEKITLALEPDPDPSVAVRRRALGRRLKSLAPR
jgi:hypothetical protein